MEQLQKVMQYENTLPEDFDGVFKFTNDTDEEFVGKWGNKEYRFPPHSTSPMIMPQFSALEVQSIRKKFARDLAEREFFNGERYKKLLSMERNSDGSAKLASIHGAGTYSEGELVSLIQRCLKPLAGAKAIVKDVPRFNLEDALSKDDEGNLNTIAVDKGLSNDEMDRRRKTLRKKALGE